jgi:hypothetical protein
MGLDIRWPIALLFSIYGIILLVYGYFLNPEVLQTRSLGINIDLWWGAAMLGFALFMGILALRGSRQDRP